MLIKFFNILKLELYLWFEGIMKFIPGKIGILLRIIFYSIVKNKFFFVSISTGTSIRNIKSIEIEKGVGIGPNCFIDSTGGNIFIGQKSAFNESCHINSSVGGKIILGEKVIFGPKVLLRTANHNYSKANTSIQDSGHFFADIIIEDNEVRFTRPVLLDLGGIAKGYAVDQAINAVDDSINITVNAGGDLRMRPWRGNQVEVRHPRSPHSEFIQIRMKNCALATSAAYYSENGILIIAKDPSRSVSPDKNISVSVFAKDCLLADALTKVAYLNPHVIKKSIFPDVEFMMLDSNNVINWY